MKTPTQYLGAALKVTLTTCLTLLGLFSTPAHADFRKALDAYIARDGDTMLKEVKDAVDKKSDDGLMLFLMATNMDAATSDYDETTKQSQSTLRAILPQPKRDEMRELLVQATNNSSVDAQYYLYSSTQFSRELIIHRLQAQQAKLGEKPKAEYTNQEVNQAIDNAKKDFIEKGLLPPSDYSSASMVTKQAEAGDPYAQSLVGFYSLGFYEFLTPSCKEIKTYAPLCQTKDETKGYDLLKKAVKTYEQDGLLNEGYGKLANGMCGLILSRSNPSAKDLRQAYLWCFMSANMGNLFAVDLLGKMHNSGSLKQIAPKLDAAWDTANRNEFLYIKNLKEWPDLVIQSRKELKSEDTPIFSYLFAGAKLPTIYALNVYSDGRAFIRDVNWRTGYRTPITKVSSKHVKQFLADLHRTGIDDWSLSSRSESLYCNEATCPTFYMAISLRQDSNPRFVNIVEYDEKGANSNLKVRVHQMAKIKSIVDSYFPTKQLLIELGNSEKLKQKFLAREAEWIDLAKN